MNIEPHLEARGAAGPPSVIADGAPAAASALIDTSRGLIPAEMVLAGDFVRTASGPRRVLSVVEFPDASLLRLSLSNGSSLRCAPQQELRSRGEWVRAGAIAPGDPVYSSTAEGLFGSDLSLSLEHVSYRITPAVVRLPERWSPDLAEFVGMMSARGSFQCIGNSVVPTNCRIGVDDADVGEWILAVAEQEFGRRPTWGTSTRFPTLFFHLRDIAGALMQLCVDPEGRMRVPEGIFRAPETIVTAFLRGFFEGRGTALRGKTVTTYAREAHVLLDVQQLLLLYGIVSTIVDGHGNEGGRRVDKRLRLLGNESKRRFIESIGFRSVRKRSECAQLAERKGEIPPAVTIPRGFDMGRLKRAIYDRYRVDGKVPGGVMTYVLGFLSDGVRGRTTGITIRRARWIIDALDAGDTSAEAAFLREMVSAGYQQMTIDAIEPLATASHTLLEVEGEQGYLANGIVMRDNSSEVAELRARMPRRAAENGIPAVAPPRIFAAVPAGSPVNSSRGIVGIESVSDGDFLLTSRGPRRVRARFERAAEELLELRISDGRSLRCTPSTRLRSAGAWIAAADVAIGTRLYRSLVPGLFGVRTQLYLHYTAEHPLSGPSQIKLPSQWTPELAEFLGYALAHGGGARNEIGQITHITLFFDPDDEDLVTHIQRLSYALFNKEPSVRRTAKLVTMELYSIDIGGMLDQLGMGGRLDNRALPTSIFEAPEPIVTAFLRGYCERKLNFSRRRGDAPFLRIGCASTAVAMGIARLLALYGINGMVNAAIPGGLRNRRSAELLVTPAASRVELIDRIGLISQRKREIAAGYRSMLAAYDERTSGTADLLTIPVTADLQRLKESIMRARKASGLTAERIRVYDETAAAISMILTMHRTHVSFRRAAKIVEEIPEHLIVHHADFLLEAVRGRYFEVFVEQVERLAPAPCHGVALEGDGELLIDGYVIGEYPDRRASNAEDAG